MVIFSSGRGSDFSLSGVHPTYQWRCLHIQLFSSIEQVCFSIILSERGKLIFFSYTVLEHLKYQ